MNLLRGLTGQQRGAVAWRHLEAWKEGRGNVPPTGSQFARSLATSSSSSPEDDGSLFSSWVGKIKGVFKGNSPAEPAQEHPPAEPTQQHSPAFTLLTCADELKKVRRVEKLTKVLKMQPRVSEGTVTESLDKYETILRALAKHDPTGQHLDAKQKTEVATQCGCTIQDINRVLTKYDWMKEAHTKVLQMKEKGEGLPKTMEEMEKLLVGSSPLKRNLSQSASKSVEVGRNAPCTCGSGKKYKRCCGRGA